MKRTVRTWLLFLLAALLATSLVACDTWDTVEKNFIEAGWEPVVVDPDNDAEGRALLLRLIEEKEINKLPECEIIVCKKGGIVPLAGILRFSSGAQLRRYLDSLEGDAYATARKEGRIRGNCYLFYAGYGAIEIYTK